ncbi:MAG: hypothetical protein ABIJ12_14225 [bacterium]
MDKYAWYPHPGPQENFCGRWEYEVLYGGAAGGGKTDCLIMEATRYVGLEGYKAVIFRRTFPQLQEVIDRTREYYPLIGGEYKASEHRWSFPGGATIKLGHMAETDSHYNYLGDEFQYIAFDEAGQFLPKQLIYLHSRCRTTNPAIPLRVRYGSNPGGPAHRFLKDRFRIGSIEPYTTITDDRTGLPRVFVPAKVADNPSLTENDPDYIARLMQLPELERMRLLEGVWDAFEGQKFAELNRDIHGFDDELPFEWETFGAFDWGYARPWAYGIFRVDYNGKLYLDQYHYALKPGAENIGLRQTDTEIARAILALEKKHNLKPRWRVAGPDIFNPKRKKDGMMGPSPAEEMMREGVTFIKADDSRVIGWQQIHHRLQLDEDGQPWLFARRSLDHWWRCMEELREDERNPEDVVQKDIEDHLPEMTRYACMTRPMRPKVSAVADTGSFQAERRKYIKAKQYASRKGISIADAYRTGRF